MLLRRSETGNSDPGELIKSHMRRQGIASSVYAALGKHEKGELRIIFGLHRGFNRVILPQ